jgi:hypothetical protein
VFDTLPIPFFVFFLFNTMYIMALETINFVLFPQSLHYFYFLFSFFHIPEEEQHSWFLNAKD